MNEHNLHCPGPRFQTGKATTRMLERKNHKNQQLKKPSITFQRVSHHCSYIATSYTHNPGTFQTGKYPWIHCLFPKVSQHPFNTRTINPSREKQKSKGEENSQPFLLHLSVWPLHLSQGQSLNFPAEQYPIRDQAEENLGWQLFLSQRPTLLLQPAIRDADWRVRVSFQVDKVLDEVVLPRGRQ